MTEITIYTSSGAVTYILRNTRDDYITALVEGLEKGTVTATTAEGSTLYINPLNAAAIEIKAIEEDTPPDL